MTKAASELAHLFRALKAPAAARALPALADRAREEQWSYERFAEVLLTQAPRAHRRDRGMSVKFEPIPHDGRNIAVRLDTESVVPIARATTLSALLGDPDPKRRAEIANAPALELDRVRSAMALPRPRKLVCAGSTFGHTSQRSASSNQSPRLCLPISQTPYSGHTTTWFWRR
jgi:hypothetical protein